MPARRVDAVVAHPGELAALVDDVLDRFREGLVGQAVEHDPADREHALAALPLGLVVHVECERPHGFGIGLGTGGTGCCRGRGEERAGQGSGEVPSHAGGSPLLGFPTRRTLTTERTATTQNITI
jgi:hypothetical protein